MPFLHQEHFCQVRQNFAKVGLEVSLVLGNVGIFGRWMPRISHTAEFHHFPQVFAETITNLHQTVAEFYFVLQAKVFEGIPGCGGVEKER